MLCFYRRRQKWECPGGHMKACEQPLAAVKQELFEETGALDFDIVPVWDFQPLNDDGTLNSNGRAYHSEIRWVAPLPQDSEMERIEVFDDHPPNVTYDCVEMMKTLITRSSLRWPFILKNNPWILA